MYIAPNTKVYVCRGIKWTNNYEHTVAFNNQTEQRAFILSHSLQTYTSNYYQREGRDYIRVKMPIGSAQSCNYLCWRNESFETISGQNDARWFFAFITGVEYVNNEVTEISYEIDVMQTFFLFYADNQMQFVEREIPIHDVAGDNLVPENIEIGDYVNSNIITSESFGTGMNLRNWSIVVACTFNNDSSLSNARGGFYAGTFSGVKYIAFTDPVACADFLARVVEQNKVSGVVSVFMMPRDFITGSQEVVGNIFPTATQKTFTYTIDNTKVSGHTPRNKKLLTYPFSFIVASNNNGNAAEFKIERFTGNSITFSLVGSMNCNPQIALIPNNYDGFGTNAVANQSIGGKISNMDEKLMVSGFPQCSFAVDSYKAWLAQNSYGLALGAASAVGSMAVGAMTGRVSTAAIGFSRASSLMAEVLQHRTLPPHAQGSDTSGALGAMRRLDFTIMQRQITKEFAEIIDSYFDRYGYAVHKLKSLDIRNRPHWYYVKTIDADIHGTFTNDYARKIESILNNGITFWRAGNEIGQYWLDNRPSS